MKKILILFTLIILVSCKSTKIYSPDYSNNASIPIGIVKGLVSMEKENEFEVEIRNSHGGYYQVNSKIKNLIDSIYVENHIINFHYGTKTDTILKYAKSELIKKLNYELKIADRQIKLAGNYQTIKIITDDTTKVFYTRQGLGLMGVLENGEHIFKVPE